MLCLKLFVLILINLSYLWKANGNLNDCGKSQVGQGNIIGGTQVPRGLFPW